MRFLLPILLLLIAAHAATTQPADETASWEETFKSVYNLKENENLKRIAPPFIPQRLDHYRIREASQARDIKEPPTYFLFHWRDNELKGWGYGFISGSGLTLGGVLHTVLDLSNFEFEGPKEVISIKLPGDWIVRPDAPIEQKLDDLKQIVRKASRKSVRFEQQKLPRSVIVVTGNYTADTRDEKGRMIDVNLYVDRLDPDEGSGGGSGTMDKFITRIGDLADCPVAIETPSRPIGTISWRTHSSSYLYRQPPGAEREEKLKTMLQHVNEQTGLEFAIERREVPVWVISEESAK